MVYDRFLFKECFSTRLLPIPKHPRKNSSTSMLAILKRRFCRAWSTIHTTWKWRHRWRWSVNCCRLKMSWVVAMSRRQAIYIQVSLKTGDPLLLEHVPQSSKCRVTISLVCLVGSGYFTQPDLDQRTSSFSCLGTAVDPGGGVCFVAVLFSIIKLWTRIEFGLLC